MNTDLIQTKFIKLNLNRLKKLDQNIFILYLEYDLKTVYIVCFYYNIYIKHTLIKII